MKRRRGLAQRIRRSWTAAVREFSLLDDAAVDSFAGAQGGRLLLDWGKSITSADDDVRGSARKLRARARDLERNDAYVRQFLALLTSNVVGPHGVALDGGQVLEDGRTPDRALNQALERGWYSWATAPVTVDGRMNLLSFQNLLLRTVARDGEVFVRKWAGFRGNRWRFALEAIDADQIDETLNRRPSSSGGAEIRMGIEVDPFGAPLAYYVSEGTGGILDPYALPAPIAASQILHLYRPDRVNQTRAVTWLHSVMVPLKMLNAYIEAEIVAARTASAKQGFFVQKDGGGEGASLGPEQPLTMDASPGVLEKLPPGFEFQGWDPDHPTTAFPSFIKAMLRTIATGLGVSYNALANDLEGVNYSSIRSGLLIERDLWRQLQEWWIASFLQPVYEGWIRSASLTDELALPSPVVDPATLFAVQWTPRGYDWVDPLSDTQAAELQISLGLSSRTRFINERGLDREAIFQELNAEAEDAARLGLDVSGSKATAEPSPTGGEGKARAAEPGSPNGKARGGSRLEALGVFTEGSHA